MLCEDTEMHEPASEERCGTGTEVEVHDGVEKLANIFYVYTAAMGGAYEFTKSATANLREKDDTYNPTIGGFFAGSILGLRCMSTKCPSISCIPR